MGWLAQSTRRPFPCPALGLTLHWLHLCEVEPLKSKNSCRFKRLHISTLWQVPCSVRCTEVLKCLGEEPQRGRGIFKMFNLSQGKCQENPYFELQKKEKWHSNQYYTGIWTLLLFHQWLEVISQHLRGPSQTLKQKFRGLLSTVCDFCFIPPSWVEEKAFLTQEPGDLQPPPVPARTAGLITRT